MTLWKWSQTAASNGSVDATVNFVENQSPSTYNDSARAVMAAVAKARDDWSGSGITTGGTSTAYTLSTSQVITSLQDKFKVLFTLHTDCGAAPTLAVDSQTAKHLRPYHGVDFASGDMKGGAIYSASYNSSNGEWIVEGWFGNLLNPTNFSTSFPDLNAIEALSSTGIAYRTGSNAWSLDQGTTALIFEKDNGSATLATGTLGDHYCPFACTITGVTVLADQSGSAVVDVWRDSYANYPPTVADTITASALPTLSSATKYQDTTLTGWTVAVSAGDTLRFNLNSVTSITRLTIILTVKRYG